jgi:type I restriction enzyme R subunit
MSNEADTCRKTVVPKLQAAGWDDDPHRINEQVTFTDGRIIPIGDKVKRGKQKRADYILRYTRDLPLAVVEAKADYKQPGDGMQQAKEYAEILDVKFAYASNGAGIVEFDFLTGLERELVAFPPPQELWERLHAQSGLSQAAQQHLRTPLNHQTGKPLRYYQEIAVRRVVQAVLAGRQRILVTMATGTGKTMVAFQICWQLWSSRWNRTGEHRRPRILYLADRNILVDDPKDKTFLPFGDARHKIENGEVVKSREIYFAIYQAIAGDESRAAIFQQFPRDFFDLIIVDECHRGSARADSAWRAILEYFAPAVQLGMTATPLRDESRDTYAYFRNPVYTYSLAQGIADGFLAPYRVHRVVTDVDALGWRPTPGELDRYGRAVPDEEYQTQDFERVVALRARSEAIARHLAGFMREHGRFDKTVVFCVDQPHADEMRRLLGNANADLVQIHPDYVCRVTAEEGDIGRGHLSRFQELEKETPVILTTSQMLTTGVDAPMIKNVVIARVVGSMAEFKQIIGRGTRVRDDYGKTFFNIIDYTGSATRQFADPAFDGEPALIDETTIDTDGNVIAVQVGDDEMPSPPPEEGGMEYEPGGFPGVTVLDPDADDLPPRKYYVDGGTVAIVASMVYEYDAQGKKQRIVKYADYTADAVRTLSPSAAILRNYWADADARGGILLKLAERGIDFDLLAEVTGQPDADPFDLLCHVAYNAPLRTRRERAVRLRQEMPDFFARYAPEARAILDELLEKYAEHGAAQFAIPDVLKLPPIADHGNVGEIVRLFGGAQQLRDAVGELQALLYAA